MDLSIVFGTWNRLDYLKECMESIDRYCAGLEYEVIVVDGGSTDGTLEYLETYPVAETHRNWTVRQKELLGAVKAFNAGFRLARGKYVYNFNDDAVMLDNAAQEACELLDKRKDVGQVAIPFSGPHIIPKLDVVLLKKAWLYANFGVIRRELGQRLKWWGDYLHTYGGDAELSMMVWNAGYRVWPMRGFEVHHREVRDGLRRRNTDSPNFYAKWRRWRGPGDRRPEFWRDPAFGGGKIDPPTWG